MATLLNNQIANTYPGLFKTYDNGTLISHTHADAVYLSDGVGTKSALSLSQQRVGVGTVAPNKELHVKGQIQWTSASDDSWFGWVSASNVGTTYNSTGYYHMFDKDILLSGAPFQSIRNSDSEICLTIDANQKVTAAADLDVTGDLRVNGGDIWGPADTDLKILSDKNIELRIDQDTDGTHYIKFRAGSTSKVEINESGDIQADGNIDASGALRSITSCAVEFGNAAHANIDIDSMTGTNVAGKDMIFSAGQGTGSGEGGEFIFKIATKGGSGSSVNSLGNTMKLKEDKRTWINRLYVGAESSGTYPSTNIQSAIHFGEPTGLEYGAIWAESTLANYLIFGGNASYKRFLSTSGRNSELHLRPEDNAAKEWKIMATHTAEQLAFKANTNVRARIWQAGGLRLEQCDGGVSAYLELQEGTTPTAVTNYGKIYTKNDNKLYFQDGAGTEKEVAFV
jgi:hypothetical protein